MFKYKQALRSEPDFLRLARQYKDIRAFLALYTGKRLKMAVASGRWNRDVSDLVVRKINEVCEMVRELGLEDVDSLVAIAFLESVHRYDPKEKVRKELGKQGIEYDMLAPNSKKKYDLVYPEVGFEGFILNYFKYRLKKKIDAETRGYMPGVGKCKAYADEETGVTAVEKAQDNSIEEFDRIFEIVQINHEWVSGESAHWPFSELNIQERWLIRMKYAEKRYSNDIAEKIGVSPSIVRSRLAAVRERLLKIIEEHDKNEDS